MYLQHFISNSGLAAPQVTLDAAFAVTFREIMAQRSGGPIYMWADSSPQAGFDFLLSVFDQIAPDKLTGCLEKAQDLYSSVEDLRKALASKNFEAGAEIALKRDAAAAFLMSSMKRHHQMPMGLGSGATTLEHKCQALATKFCHESLSFQHIRATCSDVIGLTVDLGTESGVADASGGDVIAYLPPWIQRTACLQEDQGLEVGHIQASQIFPNSLISPGLDHVANNMQDAMDQQLAGWEAWLPGFKALSHMLSHRHLLQRLVARCIRGTPHEVLTRMFETAVQPVAKWRWGTICKTLPHVLRFERALRIVWNQQRFLCKGEAMQNADESDESVFSCSLVTATVQDQMWWAYGHMLVHLHQVGNFPSA